jgi:far upstream element-binding protein
LDCAPRVDLFTTRRTERLDARTRVEMAPPAKTPRGDTDADDAPSSSERVDWAKKTVAQLKQELTKRSLATDGLKAALVARLTEDDDGKDAVERKDEAPADADAVGAAKGGTKRAREVEEKAGEEETRGKKSEPSELKKTKTTTPANDGKENESDGDRQDELLDDDYKTLVTIGSNAGRVIGKGGETLKYIERRCECKLDFRRDEGICVVKPRNKRAGNSVKIDAATKKQFMAEAKRLIEEVANTGQIMDRLTENVPTNVNEGIQFDPNVIPAELLNGDPEEEMMVDIPCHGREGRVIGRGAATIREISARSGANCHVVKGSGVCTAKGKRRCIAIAYQMVNDTLSLAVDRFANVPSQNAPQGMPQMGVPMGMPQGAMMLPNGMAMVPMSAMGYQVPMQQQPQFGGQTGLDTTIEVPCSGNEGRIVGKGGEMIKHLRAVTGCMVDIKDNKTPAAVVVISGQAANVELCRSYVVEVMELGDTRSQGRLNGMPLTGAPQYAAQQAPYAQQHAYQQPAMQQQGQYYAAMPAPAPVGGEWHRYHDAQGKPYEHNPATGETRWV